jgi:hypothetical protein
LVVHDVLDESAREEAARAELLERLEWESIAEEAISVLKIARAALIYAARAVDAAEALKRREREGLVVDLPVLQLDPLLNEIG